MRHAVYTNHMRHMEIVELVYNPNFGSLECGDPSMLNVIWFSQISIAINPSYISTTFTIIVTRLSIVSPLPPSPRSTRLVCVSNQLQYTQGQISNFENPWRWPRMWERRTNGLPSLSPLRNWAQHAWSPQLSPIHEGLFATKRTTPRPNTLQSTLNSNEVAKTT